MIQMVMKRTSFSKCLLSGAMATLCSGPRDSVVDPDRPSPHSMEGKGGREREVIGTREMF